MKFQYSEKKVKLPGNVHAYAEKKVMKLARFFEEDAEALIVFSVEKNQNKVELTVHGAGTWFRASESTSDMFASIDAAVSTIEGQIRKNKTRLARRLRQDAFTRTVQEETSFVPEPEEDAVGQLRQIVSERIAREGVTELPARRIILYGARENEIISSIPPVLAVFVVIMMVAFNGRKWRRKADFER